MPTSPEAASVVERLRLLVDNLSDEDPNGQHVRDLEALLAFVEAAKELDDEWKRLGSCETTGPTVDEKLRAFIAALDALYTPDSAEERE